MSYDITRLLARWDYVPGEIVVRKIKGRDGEEKIQLRVDLGILQLNLSGRPDGKRPMGHESWFDHYRLQMARYREAHGGNSEGFSLDNTDCGRLLQESIQYHHRYICLLELKDYPAVLRDTERNLRLGEFLDQFAPEELAWSIQQFGPQLLLIRTRAQAEMAQASGDHALMIEQITGGVTAIREFLESHDREELIEHSGELRSLEVWKEDLQSRRPRTEREQLESDLADAVKREDYEKAAAVRDALRQMPK